MLLRSVHSSKSVAAPLAPGVLRKTEAGAFQIDGHTLLKGCRLHPGHAVWAEDISALPDIRFVFLRIKAEGENIRKLLGV